MKIYKVFLFFVILFPFILAVSCVISSDNENPPNENPPNEEPQTVQTVSFNNLTANGSSTQTTTQLYLTFSQSITGLTADDITLSNVSGIKKGTLQGSGSTYTLPISGFNSTGSLSVSVEKIGYVINDIPMTVQIFYTTNAILNSVLANGSLTQTTTQLTLTFNQTISGLTADDITLSGVSGISKGTLSGTGSTYILPISGFNSGGTLSVTVNRTGFNISGSSKTVPIFYVIPVILNNVTVNGSSAQTTTQLTFNFDQAIENLSVNDITLSGLSGANNITKTISGSGTSYILSIGNVTSSGLLTITIEKSGYAISGSPKTVTIYFTPVAGIIINLSGLNEWDVLEQSIQVTANTNKVFTVNGTYSKYQWFIDGILVGTSSSFIFNKLSNTYQLTVVVTNSNGESRSGRCRIFVN